MLLVGRRAKARQGLEDRVPHPELAPAGKAREHRVPIAVSLGKVAPRRACAQNPKDAVDRSPLECAGPRSPRSGSKGLRMCQSASVKSPRLNAASLRKATWNHLLMKKSSTRRSH